MSSRLNVLLIEDTAVTGQLLAGQLRQHDPETRCQRAHSLGEFKAEIQKAGWDLVLLCDGIPQLEVRSVWEIVQARWPDLPLILIGEEAGGEEVADLLKLGVADFVRKDNPGRLLPSIKRSLWEAAVRQARREADTALVQSEDKYRNLFEFNRDATLTSDLSTGKFTSANPAALKMFGAATEVEIVGLTPAHLSPDFQPDGRPSVEILPAMVEIVLREGSHFFEWNHRRLDGRVFASDVLLACIQLDGKPVILGTIREISERKRTEELLHESEKQFRATFETVAIGMAQAHPHTGQFLRVNHKMCAITGYTESELCRMRVIDITHPEDRQMDQEGFQKIIRGETPAYHIEKRYVHKGGAMVWVNVNMTVIRDAAGQPVRTVAAIEDISVRKAAEQALLDSRTKLAAAMSSMTDAVFISDGAGQFVDFNDAFATFHKFKSKTETLRRLEDYPEILEVSTASGELVPLEMWCVPRALRGETATNVEFAFRRKDTNETWVGSFSFSPVRDTEGAIVGAVVVGRDVTERQKQTEELRLKTAFLEALVHSSADGIAVVDNQMRKVFQNQKLLDLWKIPLEIARESDGHLEEEIVLAQTLNPAEYQSRIRHILAHPDEPAQDEIILKNGTALNRHTSLVRDHNGKNYGRVWTYHDITKRRDLERQVRQAQKMEAIGTLAGGIAHDFNNILCSIFGYSYLLQRELAGNIRAEEYIDEILTAANRAKDLVQQILTFSRQREQKREVIRLGPVVADAMKFLRASLPADIQIQKNLAEEAPAVFADPTQIYQITMNLATNALHAMESRGGQLTVTLAAFEPDEDLRRAHPGLRPALYTRLTISDTGAGMDAVTLERIFEPFFTTKAVGKGTGLGLSVVHGIVQSHEGVITVASIPGKGTTFDLYFPARANAAVAGAAAPRALPQGEGGGILYVDDELALTKPLQRLLESLNYRVSLSNLPSDALRQFAENPGQFKLVITDLTMPEMSGLEVARRVHEIRPDIPVMLISGHAPELSREKLQEVGISGMLEKPFSLTALAEMVKSLAQ